LPESNSLNWPFQLHRHGDVMWAVPWRRDGDSPAFFGLVPVPGVHHSDMTADLLLSGYPGAQPEWAEPGLSYARQARFPWD